VKPGKHSIYVYEPVSDKFYQKIIVVQSQKPHYTTIEQSDIKNTDGSALQAKNPLKLREKGKSSRVKAREELQAKLDQAHLNDTRLDILNISHLFRSKGEILGILSQIEKHYETLSVVFRELQSESHDSYPLVSRKGLLEFCLATKLLSEEQFNSEELKQFSNVNRSQFLLFIVRVFQVRKENKTTFGEFLNGVIVPLISNSTWLETKFDGIQNKDIQALIQTNKVAIYQFLD
jgi:hypothetical protein